MKEGWICPRCRVVNSPYIDQCNCKEEKEEESVAIKVPKPSEFVNKDKLSTNTIEFEECEVGGNHEWLPVRSTVTTAGVSYRFICTKCYKVKY